jgi:diguanylate cyclase (GGDEF)-like protein
VDSCLITIAATLDAVLHRPANLVARFGGEECIVLLPNTGLGGGANMAEQMHQKTSALHIPHYGSTVGLYGTMSFGVSSIIPLNQTIPDNLIAMAKR